LGTVTVQDSKFVLIGIRIRAFEWYLELPWTAWSGVILRYYAIGRIWRHNNAMQ